ncbi:MAG: hypothetical protein R3D98_13030 [Candidatus Krumholzibacteriia bacterium]
MAKRNRPGKPPAPSATASVQPVRSAWLARGRGLAPWLGVFVLLALLYPGPMFEGTVYGSADASAADAFRQVGDASRHQGEYPFWNPYLFVGMPTFGSLAYTLGVYPPTYLFEFLHTRLGLPPLTWLFGHLLLGGVGVWWLLGRWRLPWSARLLGCVGWLWFARVVAWGVHGHGSKLAAAMALPWLVGLAWEVLVRGRVRSAGLLALVLGLQFLRGHVQISYYTLLLLGALTLWNLLWPLGDGARPAWRERVRRLGLMSLAVVLGLAVGSVLLMPVHEYAALSTRGESGASGGGGSPFDYATQWSLAPEDLAAMVIPAAAGFGKATYAGRMPFTDYPNYLGLLLPALAAAAWLTRRRSLVAALAVVSVLAIVLAMGRFSPGLYQAAYAVLPYFSKFRVPSMVLVLPALLVAVLAAFGAHALSGLDDAAAGRLRRVAVALLGLGAVLTLAGATGAVAGAYRDHLAALAARSGKPSVPELLDAAWSLHRALLVRQGLVLLAAGGALVFAAGRASFRRVGLMPVLCVLVAIDLGSVARLVTQPERALIDVVRTADGGARLAPAARLEHRWRPDQRVQLPADLARDLAGIVGHDRVLPLGDDAGNNAFMTAGIRSLGGYHAAKPAAAEAIRQRLFNGVPQGRVARWLGAAAITYPGTLGPDALALLADRGLTLRPEGQPASGRMIYRLADPLPRARLVSAWRPAVPAPEDGLEPFLDAVADGRHDPAELVVLDAAPSPAPESGPEPLPRPEFIDDGLDRVVLRARTPRPALLLLADQAAPGWRVSVDGEPSRLLVADHMLRAVALPAGDHEVRFEYRDPAFARGIRLACGGLLVSLVLIAWPWIRRRGAVPSASVGE